jgi:hypothetical protein
MGKPDVKAASWPMIAARIATISLGLAAMGWGFVVMPLVRHQTSMSQMARKIIGGERYGPGLLAGYADVAERDLRQDVCQPVNRRTLAVIRLRLAEEALADGDGDKIERTRSALEAAVLSALACTPADPLLWLTVFWMQNNTRGLQDDNFKSLRMSYRFGPNEGWLAIRRNRYTVAIYPALSEDLKKHAVDEFDQLVKSDFITDAAEIIVGPGRPISDRLLSSLDGIDVQKLRFLGRLLDGKGFEAKIPGIPNTPRFPSG